ncbi:DUF262 domain-containing protein [Succinivibrio dextrinosolvens]|uniref:DUF262 domain-containing protein n=1 Tax=Succinivibrio dextrinosolvens TaxID=83771 RepID=UPI00241D7A16|nr:DUF262 domain-containing protein [Succinivibrio dextrinosolvens]MBE6422797.1 DUF262 domain-containing protein [Succinivibrio dextrinosolvens]
MGSFQTPISIYNAVINTMQNEYVLPIFQRAFVWSEYDIEKLFDSIMQGFPINSMLFWQLKSQKENFTSIKFYSFIQQAYERVQNQNEVEIKIEKDVKAVLDGQQRLTALRIGLFGSYWAHIYKKSWECTNRNFLEKKLYICISKTFAGEIKYLFKFKSKEDSNNWADIYEDRNNTGYIWFRVSCIIDLNNNINGIDLDEFLDNHVDVIDKDMRKIVRKLHKVIFIHQSVNFYLEETTSAQTAVEIFNRVNSGGKKLETPDILYAILVSYSNSTNFRKEFSDVEKTSSDKGIPISKYFILKIILFLFHKSVKSSIDSFSKEFCENIEKKWEKIRNCIYESINLLRAFGFYESNLTSYNAVLPIIYYIYHRDIYDDFANVISYKEERKQIKTWLITVLLRRAFGGSSDSTLQSARLAFEPDIENNIYISNSIKEFPVKAINSNISKDLDEVNDEFLSSILNTQKDHKNCFSILSLLYPNLDYKNNNFHKDHLHPDSCYKDLSEEIKKKIKYEQYNSIVNLQMLDGNENESKKDKSLKEWVEECLKEAPDRQAFFKNHIIPDINLELDNYEEFYNTRKSLLMNKLRDLLEN